MVLKKRWISLAAATVLTAALTGCGGGSSTPVATTDDTAGTPSTGDTTTTTTTTPTSIEVVDGKVLNAKVTAHYLDEQNNTQSIELVGTKTYTNVVDGTTVKSDSYAYKIPDSNLSVADKIRYFKVDATTAEVKDLKSYPAAFIDVDLSGDYNASVDQALNKTFYAPKGVKYVSPVTTLVYNLVKTELENNEVNETKIANAIELVAKKLNLTADDIKNVDPLTEPEYGFINAMLAAYNNDELETIATELENDTTTVDSFDKAIQVLATVEEKVGKTIFSTVKENLNSGVFTVEDLKNLNFDEMRESDGMPVLKEGEKTAFTQVRAIEIDGEVNASDLLNSGDKLNQNGGVIKFTFENKENTDENATAKVDLLVQVANPQSRMEESAQEDQIVIKVAGLDLKKVNGTTTLEYNASTAKTSYEWYNTSTSIDKNYISMLDKNGTELSISDAFGNNSDINISKLVSLIDTNASGETNGSASAMLNILSSGNIADVKVVLVDNDGALELADTNGNPVLWSTATVAGKGNKIVGQGKRIINIKADARGTTTELNKPNAITNIEENGTALNSGQYTTTTTNLTNKTVVVNLDTNDSAEYVDFNLTATIADGIEDNTSVYATIVDRNITKFVEFVGATKTDDTNKSKVHLKVDPYPATGYDYVGGHPKSIVQFQTKDEFGKESKLGDYNVTFELNRLPAVVSGISDDANISALVANTGDGNCSVKLFEDKDNDPLLVDVNITSDVNTTISKLPTTYDSAIDFNISSSSTVKVWLDNNSTLYFGCTKEALESNLSSDDTNISILTVDLNDTYGENTNIDTNITFGY